MAFGGVALNTNCEELYEVSELLWPRVAVETPTKRCDNQRSDDGFSFL